MFYITFVYLKSFKPNSATLPAHCNYGEDMRKYILNIVLPIYPSNAKVEINQVMQQQSTNKNYAFISAYEPTCF